MTSPTDLDAGYRAMAADTPRETEAQEWCKALANDPHEREILDWIEQAIDTTGWTAPDDSDIQKTANAETQIHTNAQDAAEHDAWFRREVQRGLDSANAGNLIAAEDVEAEAAAWRSARTREALADVDAGRVVDHAALNLPKIPNAETRAAIAEAEAIIAAGSARFTSAEDLFRDLDAATKKT